MHAGDDHDPYGTVFLSGGALAEVRPAVVKGAASPARASGPSRREAPARAAPAVQAPAPQREGPPATTGFAAKTAGEVCRQFEPGDEARRLLGDGQLPARTYLDRLIERREYRDAIGFLAHALPKREAVWWACQCARGVLGPNPPAAALAALQAAERWAADPNDAHRRAAYPAGEAAGLVHPAGTAAVAAFVSGGSLAPAGLPAVAPAELLTARMVSGAVLLASIHEQPQKSPERQRGFIALGIEVAGGTNRWK